MRTTCPRLLLAASILGAFSACSNPKSNLVDAMNAKENTFLSSPEHVRVVYPKTKTVAVVDTFFGTPVADPFRWMEAATAADSADLQDWIEAESNLAQHYLKGIPQREPLRKRLTEIWNYAKMSAPFREGDRFYAYKNDGLQNQSVLYQLDAAEPEASGKVFLDPNTLAADGTVALQSVEFSTDARYAAYMTSSAGSDWASIQVLDVASGKTLADKIEWVKFSGIAWYKDGFYYSRYDAPEGDQYTRKNEFHQVFYHKIGTPQSEDIFIFGDRSAPERMFQAQVTEDERFLILYASETTSGNWVYVQRLGGSPQGEPELLTNDAGFVADYSVVDNNGDNLLILTNNGAPNYQLMEANAATPTMPWRKLLPERPNAVLESVQNLGGKLVANYTQDAQSKIQIFEPSGQLLKAVELPLGTVSGINGKKTDAQAYLTFSSFVTPPTIYQLDLSSGNTTVWRTSPVNVNPDDYEVKQVFYESKDKTKVPMFLVYKKGLVLDGNNPTLLYGYGGFNISLLPSFALGYLPFLEKGGIYAVANLRGGGEYGKTWHEAGTKLKKQNVFDDFIAAAEYLIAERYTSKPKLAIEGRSNGGLLIGACITQRPDLFEVALPIVGVLDMMRYHLFTIGSKWATDYGTRDNQAEFEALIKYSPVHNVRKVSYPATLVMTAEYDDRVVPVHSYKFAAALQANNTGPRAMLLRIDRKAGHGAGKPTEKQIEELADKLGFVMFNLKME